MATSDLLPRVRDIQGRRSLLLAAVGGGSALIYLANRLIQPAKRFS